MGDQAEPKPQAAEAVPGDEVRSEFAGAHRELAVGATSLHQWGAVRPALPAAWIVVAVVRAVPTACRWVAVQLAVAAAGEGRSLRAAGEGGSLRVAAGEGRSLRVVAEEVQHSSSAGRAGAVDLRSCLVVGGALAPAAGAVRWAVSAARMGLARCEEAEVPTDGRPQCVSRRTRVARRASSRVGKLVRHVPARRAAAHTASSRR